MSSGQTFVPSNYSLDVGEKVEESAEQSGPGGKEIAEFLPVVKGILGLDDPTQQEAKLESQLRTLRQGGLPATTLAWTLGTMGNVPNAIKRVKDKLSAIREQSYQSETRNRLYTALAVTGVAAGGLLSVYLLAKVYTTLQEGRVRRAEYRKITAGV